MDISLQHRWAYRETSRSIPAYKNLCSHYWMLYNYCSTDWKTTDLPSMQTDTIHVMQQQLITYWTSMRSFSPDETQQNTLCLLCFLAPMTAFSFFIPGFIYTSYIHFWHTAKWVLHSIQVQVQVQSFIRHMEWQVALQWNQFRCNMPFIP